MYRKPALLLIGNKSEDTLSFVDAQTLQEVAKITTGRGPHEVAVIQGDCARPSQTACMPSPRA